MTLPPALPTNLKVFEGRKQPLFMRTDLPCRVGKGLARKIWEQKMKTPELPTPADAGCVPYCLPSGCREGWHVYRTSPENSGKDLNTTGEEPAQGDHRGGLQIRGEQLVLRVPNTSVKDSLSRSAGSPRSCPEAPPYRRPP